MRAIRNRTEPFVIWRLRTQSTRTNGRLWKPIRQISDTFDFFQLTIFWWGGVCV